MKVVTSLVHCPNLVKSKFLLQATILLDGWREVYAIPNQEVGTAAKKLTWDIPKILSSRTIAFRSGTAIWKSPLPRFAKSSGSRKPGPRLIILKEMAWWSGSIKPWSVCCQQPFRITTVSGKSTSGLLVWQPHKWVVDNWICTVLFVLGREAWMPTDIMLG